MTIYVHRDWDNIPVPIHQKKFENLWKVWLPYLREGEIKIYITILALTDGYDGVTLSLQDLHAITGLNVKSITASVKKLQQKNLLIKEVKGPEGSQVTYYEIPNPSTKS